MSHAKVIIVHESLWQSIVKDLVSTGALLGAVAVGIWIGSEAIQWIAAIVWILWLIGRAARATKDEAVTYAEARKRLDAWESSK